MHSEQCTVHSAQWKKKSKMDEQDIFQSIKEFKSYNVEGQNFRVPIRCRRLDSFFTICTAEAEKVRG